jgi:hypothetical protein
MDGGGEKGEKGSKEDVVDKAAAECGVVVVRYCCPAGGGCVGGVGPPGTLLVGVVVENDDEEVYASGVRKLCNNGFSTTTELLLFITNGIGIVVGSAVIAVIVACRGWRMSTSRKNKWSHVVVKKLYHQ